MDYLLSKLNSEATLFLLVFVRISGIFIMCPVFGRKNVPAYFKIGFSLLLSYAIIGFHDLPQGIVINNFTEMAFYVIKELLVGLIIGYITSLFFSTLLLAGQIIDAQIGFGIASVFDPQNNIQVPLVGNINNLVALLLFFTLNGHHTLLQLLFYTFSLLPIGKVWLDPTLSDVIVQIFIKLFVLSFKIALPLIAAAFLCEIGLGILIKIIPQLNVFVIGIPLKVLIGLFALFLFIPVYIGVLNGAFQTMFDDIGNVLRRMAIQ